MTFFHMGIALAREAHYQQDAEAKPRSRPLSRQVWWALHQLRTITTCECLVGTPRYRRPAWTRRPERESRTHPRPPFYPAFLKDRYPF